ncbi:MAG: hypothetical protein AAGJ96_04270, partial [Pseudomonadota bacterium]
TPAPSTASLDNAAPIGTTPLAVRLERDMGPVKVATARPRMAIAGYNIGGVTYAEATGTANNSLRGGQGSRTTVALRAIGIDEAVLTRIATAAHNDLVDQLTAAGFEVIAASDVAAAAEADVVKLGGSAYEGSIDLGRGEKTVLVAGPQDVGVRALRPIAKVQFGLGNTAKLSEELDAVIVQPNLVLDIVSLEASRARLTGRSSASATLRFGIEPSSLFALQATEDGRFSLMSDYRMEGSASSDAPFGVIGTAVVEENNLEQGLGLLLGAATATKKSSASPVGIDVERYEALALNAARGWNAAFVAEMRAARGG